VHQQEIKELRTRRQIEITETSSRIEQQYNAELQRSLQELRDQYEQQMRANREDVDRMYENKVCLYFILFIMGLKNILSNFRLLT
jgi:lamin B